MDISSKIAESKAEIKRDLTSEKAELPSLLSGPGVLSGLIPPTRKEAEYLKAAVGWVYACAAVIADEIAGIKIRLYRNKINGEVEEVLKHPAIDIIQRANNFTTKFDHFWLTTQYLELTGEAPWFVEMNGRNEPEQLLLLRPDLIEVIKGKQEGDIIAGYTYTVNGQKIPLTAEEIVFIKYPDPNRQFRGAGPLAAATRTVDLEEFSEEYNRKFFYNSARPDGVLSTEQKLNPEQLAKMEKKLLQKYKGIGNAHKTLILEKGLKWETMGISQRDMEFIGQANFSRDKILGIFRVPRTVLGITDDVNRANAEATDYVFAKRTIKPKMERIIQQLNEFLLPKFKGTENMFYDFDNPVPEDNTARLENQKAGLQYGWLTINEARALDGYEPVEGGDEVRVPLSNTPLAEADDIPEINAFRGRDFSDRIKSMNARRRKTGKIGPEAYALIHKELTKVIAAKIRASKKKKHNHSHKEIEFQQVTPKEAAFQQKQLNLADDFEKRYAVGVRKVFNIQKAQVLEKLPVKSKAAKKDLDWRSLLLLPKAARELFAKELSALVTNMILEQSAEAFVFIDSDKTFNDAHPVVKNYLTKKAFKFAFKSTQLTNRLLGKQLADGIGKGESIPQLRKRVEKVFGAMEKYRSTRIARTETIKATNYASLEAYKDSGVVTAKQWLTALDERTCEWCGPMDRRVLGLDGKYFKKGDRFTGIQGGILKLDYESVGQPPLHPNCRCTLIPIIVEQTGNPEEIIE